MTENIINKRYYPAVDIMKFVMAILVIMLHRKPFPADMEFANFLLSNVLCHTGVPFFFMVSSFLFFRNIDPRKPESKGALWKTEKRLIILYVIWSVIYLPCVFVKSFTGHYDEITPGALLGQLLIWVKDFFINYSFLHLWYINSLIFTVLLIFLLMKKFSTKIITAVFVLLAPVSLFAVEVFQLRDFLPNLIVQLFVVSGCCVALGAMTAKCDISLVYKKKWVCLIFSLIILITLGTIRYFKQTNFMFAITQFFTYVVAFFIFIICLSADIKPSGSNITLRNYSTLIYFSHFLIMAEGFNFIASTTGITAIATSTTLQFAITVTFSFIFSFIITTLSKTKMFRWLKFVY